MKAAYGHVLCSDVESGSKAGAELNLIETGWTTHNIMLETIHNVDVCSNIHVCCTFRLLPSLNSQPVA